MNLMARTTAALAPTSQNGAVTHHHEHQMSPFNFRATSATPINPGIANTQIPPAFELLSADISMPPCDFPSGPVAKASQ
jgi:hypothetical protein